LMIRSQELLRTWPLQKHTSDRLSETAARRLLSENLTPTAGTAARPCTLLQQGVSAPSSCAEIDCPPRRLVPQPRRLILFRCSLVVPHAARAHIARPINAAALRQRSSTTLPIAAASTPRNISPATAASCRPTPTPASMGSRLRGVTSSAFRKLQTDCEQTP
jgi:hypothetical protein